MTQRSEDDVRDAVREHYGKVAEARTCAPGCCGGGPTTSLALGYSADDLAAAPDGADLGLGCGNPQAIASLKPGETVLDLGSGAGFDCFLAARQVGPTGRVLGVDMTPAMITKARENAGRIAAENVEFRLGEIERLPVADGTVNVILSNCVVNLVPDKAAVFREAFRVLARGGRLAIADVVATRAIPDDLRTKMEAFAGCIAGAAPIDDVRAMLALAGFESVVVTTRPESREFIRDWLPGSGAEDYVTSATIEATKPAPLRGCCGPSCCPPGKA